MYLEEKVAISFHYGGDNSFIQVNKQLPLMSSVVYYNIIQSDYITGAAVIFDTHPMRKTYRD